VILRTKERQFWVEKMGVMSILEEKSYIFVWNTSVRGIIIIIFFLLTISCMDKKREIMSYSSVSPKKRGVQEDGLSKMQKHMEFMFGEMMSRFDDRCRTSAASRWKNIHPHLCYLLSIWQMWGDKEFLSLIYGKMEWESPPSILVTRNSN